MKTLALNFSNGKFNKISNHLNENVVWNIVGENVYTGKAEVIQNCEQTEAYFKIVETDFKTKEVLVIENNVIITGTAEFRKNNKQLNFISACDIYEFDQEDKILKITSYCISDKN